MCKPTMQNHVLDESLEMHASFVKKRRKTRHTFVGTEHSIPSPRKLGYTCRKQHKWVLLLCFVVRRSRYLLSLALSRTHVFLTDTRCCTARKEQKNSTHRI